MIYVAKKKFTSLLFDIRSTKRCPKCNNSRVLCTTNILKIHNFLTRRKLYMSKSYENYQRQILISESKIGQYAKKRLSIFYQGEQSDTEFVSL